MTISHRLATESDLPFVCGNWLDSFRNSHGVGPMPDDLFAAVYTEAIGNLLRRPGCDVLVAFEPDEEPGMADVYGFLCAERETSRGPIVHYVYVRKSQRKEGIARGMFEAAGIPLRSHFTFTYMTPIVTKLGAKVPRAKYNPMAARFETAWQEDRKTP